MATFRVLKGQEPVKMGLADYIWLDPHGQINAKKRTILVGRNEKHEPVPLLERWGFYNPQSASATHTSLLVPAYYLPDPTRPQPHYIVLCEVKDAEDYPTYYNHRAELRSVMERLGEQGRLTWFGFEQVYTFHEDRIMGRAFQVSERHIGACFDAGLMFHSASNQIELDESEFKVGYRGFPQDMDPHPPNALTVADHLIIARYLMEKIAAEKGMTLDWGGLSPFVSTAALREPGGVDTHTPMEALTNLGQRRWVPHPAGGYSCIQVLRDTPADPYNLAVFVLRDLFFPGSDL